MKKESILAHRLRRHGLVSPARDEREYLELVRRLQPVTPVARDMPGSPPRLMHRCLGDDRALAETLRARHDLLKGRFSGGRIGYVLAADFELYATAFRRPLKVLNSVQDRVLQVLGYHDGLSPRQLRLGDGDSAQDPPARECMRRKREILEEVGRFYHPPRHHILRYAGKSLTTGASYALSLPPK